MSTPSGKFFLKYLKTTCGDRFAPEWMSRLNILWT